jgi:DNA repair protein RadC
MRYNEVFYLKDRLTRFLNTSDAYLNDHDLLTGLLLASGAGKRSTSLSNQLLEQHQTISNVLTASQEDLLRSGLSEPLIITLKLTHHLAQCHLHRVAPHRPVLRHAKCVFAYIQPKLRWLSVEHFRLLHLNAYNHLMFDELLEIGTAHSVNVDHKTVIERTLQIGTSGLIMVHNHPGGNPNPSRQDQEVTRDIVRLLAPFNVRMLDHVIVAGDTFTSMQQMGML